MNYWTTPEGRVLYSAEVSSHHVAFERRDYRTPTEKKYRGMGGFILLLSNQSHRDLHANVSPPHMPNPNLMQEIYLHGHRSDYLDQYDLFDQITTYVGMIAANSRGERQEDATLLHDNLIQQSDFIESGKLRFMGGL